METTKTDKEIIKLSLDSIIKTCNVLDRYTPIFNKIKDIKEIASGILDDINKSDTIWYNTMELPENILKKYILVQWPESQELMEYSRFDECISIQEIDKVGYMAYMCPEDLYKEIFEQ